MWPREKDMGCFLPLKMISPLVSSSFICSSKYALQWDKEKYRRKLVFYQEMYALCLNLLGISNKEQLTTIKLRNL